MPVQSLRELYVAELRDLFSAEQQVLDLLPSLVSAATAPMLRQSFETHLEQTRAQRERLTLILRQLDESPQGHLCEGMAGLVREAQERLRDDAPGDVRDAGLIALAQRIEHYEIAGYGTARTWARLLGEYAAQRLLQQTLDEEAYADRQLTELALSGINQGAGEDERSSRLERWARLRFLDVSDLHSDLHGAGAQYGNVAVRGRHDAELGVLDGFIVEGSTGRPLYYVVDSGGWFLGRRYLVPVGRGSLDAAANVLNVDLDREGAARYPEFNPASFLAMTDEDVRRYERRVLSMIAPDAEHELSYWELYERLPDYQKPAWLAQDPWSGAERAEGAQPRDLAADDVRDRGEVPAAPDARGHEILPSVGRGGPGSVSPSAEPRPTEADLEASEDARVRDPRLNQQ